MLSNGKTMESAANDWARQRLSAFVWWCVPILAGIATSLLAHSARVVAIAWMIAFAWMGTGCLLNALRCRRLHCYISAPVLFAGAVAAGWIAFGAGAFGPQALGNVVSATLVLVLLSFAPEAIWSRYVRR